MSIKEACLDHIDEARTAVNALRAIPNLILGDGSPQARGRFAALSPDELVALITVIREKLDLHLPALERALRQTELPAVQLAA